MKRILILLLSLIFICFQSFSIEQLFVETESFTNKGGWVVDQQFMDQMGSPYLMAHGLGVPVKDATTTVRFKKTGIYYIYVRTFNWTSHWHVGEGPGKFVLQVGNEKLPQILGTQGNEWIWQKVGKVFVKKNEITLSLHDLTGFNGRCDAIYFTTDEKSLPPSDKKQLAQFRKKVLGTDNLQPKLEEYDFVVIGGGIAGMCAAVSAARLGCRVALVNDRPVLGGNNSSEIRVHLGGQIGVGPYKELGNLIKEFGPSKEGNAGPAAYYEDEKKEAFIANEKNITLFLNYRAIDLKMTGKTIESITIKHIETGKEINLKSPLFSDCTGDGTIGFLAGADFMTGRESRTQFGESIAPESADKMTMGASVQWYSVEEKEPSVFPAFNYGINFTEESYEPVKRGEWTWETGMNLDQISDFERIRDYGLLVVFSNWHFLKNVLKDNEKHKMSKLSWVAYVSGKRESRRLIGDYILKEDDIVKKVFHEDQSVAATWSIDLHFPDPKNSEHFPGAEFKSSTTHISIEPYPIPYRCFYSRNIENLFMAGRNISVTHVALGAVRVMRTTGMMGEVVGMAASLCKKHCTIPQNIYRYHLNDLKKLMEEGIGKKGLPNNQNYN